MKHLKIFPKIFLYTLILMLTITLLSSGMIYLLAPIMNNDSILVEDTSGLIAPTSIPRNTQISNVILRSLPYSIAVCVVVSLVCAYFFSKAITKPIKQILKVTAHMTALEKNALCNVQSSDEIGMLSESINKLYHSLLSTIEHLKEEKDRVNEAEKQKVDFLRAASHELKTPVTALNAMLENMIMEVDIYKDYETYLPLCKEQTEYLGKMVSQILDTSKLSGRIINEQQETFDSSAYLSELCNQYQLLAQANELFLKTELSDPCIVTLPPHMFKKALSNILINAVTYSTPGRSIRVYLNGRKLVIENECVPIPQEHLKRIFEPFYRPDYARNREDGGNGLGLYIVASILDTLHISYSFCPMKNPLGMRFTIHL